MRLKLKLFLYFGALSLIATFAMLWFGFGFVKHENMMSEAEGVRIFGNQLREEQIGLILFLSGDPEGQKRYETAHEAIVNLKTPHTDGMNSEVMKEMPSSQLSVSVAGLEKYFERENALFEQISNEKKFFETYIQNKKNIFAKNAANYTRLLDLERSVGMTSAQEERLIEKLIDLIATERRIVFEFDPKSPVQNSASAFRSINESVVTAAIDAANFQIARFAANDSAHHDVYQSLGTILKGSSATATPDLLERDIKVLGFEDDVAKSFSPGEMMHHVIDHYLIAVGIMNASVELEGPGTDLEVPQTDHNMLEKALRLVADEQIIRGAAETQFELSSWYNDTFAPALVSLTADLERKITYDSSASHGSAGGLVTFAFAMSTLTIVFGVLFAVLATRVIAKPILRAKNVAIEIARGNMEVSVDTAGKDEFGELSRALDRMRLSLKTVMQEYERKNVVASERVAAPVDEKKS